MIMMGDKRKGAINAILGPDPKEEKEEGAGDGAESLHAIADELIKAVKADDPGGVADAFKAMFAECESQPHEEYDQEE